MVKEIETIYLQKKKENNDITMFISEKKKELNKIASMPPRPPAKPDTKA
jgi:hypothetical protein